MQHFQRRQQPFDAVRQRERRGGQRQHGRARNQQNDADRKEERLHQRFQRQFPETEIDQHRFALGEDQVQQEHEDQQKANGL